MIDITHHFWPGVYGKRTVMPAGTHGVQHAHTYAHCSILKRGDVMVQDGSGVWRTHSAPACIVIPAGIRHEVRALTDAEWWCIHPSDETDPEHIDESLIEGGTACRG
jgi:quercetin dioxygenase-like cupin family protein